MNRDRRFQQLRQTLRESGEQTCLRIINGRADGGPGSGHWGHAGRQGLRGGSAPGGGKMHRYTEPGNGYTSRAKILKALKPTWERVDFHSATKDELSELPLNAPIRIRGSKDTFYRDGKGNVRGIHGEKHREEDLDGAQISYRLHRFEYQDTGENWARKLYVDGVLKPEDEVTVRRTAYATSEGMEITAWDGKTYRAEKGRWVEVGPFGKISNPKDVPSSSLDDGEFLRGYAIGNLYDIALRSRGAGRKAVDDVVRTLKTCPEELRNSYHKAFADGELFADQKKGYAYYSGGVGSVPGTVHVSPKSDSSTILHEYAHFLDGSREESGIRGAGMSRKLQDQITEEMRNQDLDSIAGKTGLKTDGKGNLLGSLSMHCEAGEKLAELMSRNSSRRNSAGAMLDMVSSVTGDALSESINGGGHHSNYWDDWRSTGRTGAKVYSEPVAEYLYLRAVKDRKALNYMRTVTPNLMQNLDRLYEESFGS